MLTFKLPFKLRVWLKLKSWRFQLGVKLLKWGASLTFVDDDYRDLFKDAINRNTCVGSHVESGNHLTGYIQPMCEYDTQSVINVLRQELMVKPDLAFSRTVVTEREEYYKETWKY